jgi:uncharacterized membrane protein YsdA (DUF1294 family)
MYDDRNESQPDNSLYLVYKCFLPFVALVMALMLHMSHTPWYVDFYFKIINVVTFGFYAYDKRQAVTGGWRIPEIRLHALSLAGGAIGAELGRRIFRHKIRKWSFTFVIFFSLFLLGMASAPWLENSKRVLTATPPHKTLHEQERHQGAT